MIKTKRRPFFVGYNHNGYFTSDNIQKIFTVVWNNVENTYLKQIFVLRAEQAISRWQPNTC